MSGTTQVSGELTRLNIAYPGDESEFEVQAFLYNELRNLGFDVRGNIPAAGGAAIFDLVIFEDRKAVRIIEVKSCKERVCPAQIRRYSRYSVLVDSVAGMKQARKYVTEARLKLGSYPCSTKS